MGAVMKYCFRACGQAVHCRRDGDRTLVWMLDPRIYVGSLVRCPDGGSWRFDGNLRTTLDINEGFQFATECDALARLKVEFRLFHLRERLRGGDG